MRLEFIYKSEREYGYVLHLLDKHIPLTTEEGDELIRVFKLPRQTQEEPSLREQLGAIRTAISNVPRGGNTVVVNRLLESAYDTIGTIQLLTADDDEDDDE